MIRPVLVDREAGTAKEPSRHLHYFEFAIFAVDDFNYVFRHELSAASAPASCRRENCPEPCQPLT